MTHCKSKTKLTVCLILFMALYSHNARAQDRVALLIGNSRSEREPLEVGESLQQMAKALKEQQFHCTIKENLNRSEMQQAVTSFAQSAPTQSVAVIYYAGHALSIPAGRRSGNYLLPLEATIQKEGEVSKACFSLSNLLTTMQQECGSQANFIFLDCNHSVSPIGKVESLKPGLLPLKKPGPRTWLGAPGPSAKSTYARRIANHLAPANGKWHQALHQLHSDSGWCVTSLPESFVLPTAEEDPTAREIQPGSRAGDRLINSIGMVFRWCPAGTFQMGAKDTAQPDLRDAKPVQVTLSQGFWIGQYEVTQREYQLVTRRKPDRKAKVLGNNIPMYFVGSGNGTSFCKALNKREREAGRLPSGWEYTLPTEAEWEYACRAGTTSVFSFGDAIDQLPRYGNFADKSLFTEDDSFRYASTKMSDGYGVGPAPVGRYKSNAWGIHDMHGNLWEWCLDAYEPRLPGGKDPFVAKGSDRVIRGGGWCSYPHYCQSAFRHSYKGNDKIGFIGYRVILKRTK